MEAETYHLHTDEDENLVFIGLSGLEMPFKGLRTSGLVAFAPRAGRIAGTKGP